MSKSTPKSCRLALISANISSTPSRRKTSCASGVRQVERHRAAAATTRVGDLPDVRAAVAVLRRRLTLRRRQQGAREPVDLHAVVVEVVLPRDLGALRGQDPGQRVADRSPAGAAQVHRPGRVGRDELQVDPLTGSAPPVARTPCPSVTIERASSPAAAASSTMLRKPGPATATLLTPATSPSRLGQELGHLARRQAGRLGQLQRHVGRPVAVLADPRPLDPDLGRHRDGQLTGRDGLAHAGQDGGGELLGGHRAKATGGTAAAASRRTQRLRPGRRRPGRRPERSARPARTAWR